MAATDNKTTRGVMGNVAPRGMVAAKHGCEREQKGPARGSFYNY